MAGFGRQQQMGGKPSKMDGALKLLGRPVRTLRGLSVACNARDAVRTLRGLSHRNDLFRDAVRTLGVCRIALQRSAAYRFVAACRAAGMCVHLGLA